MVKAKDDFNRRNSSRLASWVLLFSPVFSGEMSDFLSDRGVNNENSVFSGSINKVGEILCGLAPEVDNFKNFLYLKFYRPSSFLELRLRRFQVTV